MPEAVKIEEENLEQIMFEKIGLVFVESVKNLSTLCNEYPHQDIQYFIDKYLLTILISKIFHKKKLCIKNMKKNIGTIDSFLIKTRPLLIEMLENNLDVISKHVNNL